MRDPVITLPRHWFEGPDAIFQGGAAEAQRVIRDALGLAEKTRTSPVKTPPPIPTPIRRQEPKKEYVSRLDNRSVKGIKRTHIPVAKMESVGAECSYCGDDIFTRNYRFRTLKSGEKQITCSLQCALNLGGAGWKMKGAV